MKCPDCELVMTLKDLSVNTHYITLDEGTIEYIYNCTCGAHVSISGKYWKDEEVNV